MIKLNDRAWGDFKFSELFDIFRGYYNNKPKDRLEGIGIPFVAASTYNNGLTTRLSIDTIIETNSLGVVDCSIKKNLYPSGSMTVANNGASVGSAFYHNYEYTASNAVSVLIPKFKINDYIALFLGVIIGKDKFRWSYGRTWIVGKMKNSTMSIPVDSCGDPDWQFMEDYIKQFEETKLLEIQETDYKDNVMLPSVDEWGEFLISDLFNIERGKLAKKPADSGNVMYVGASGFNNGVTGFFDIEDRYIHDTSRVSLLTVANNGSVGETFIQTLPFAASSDVNVLTPKEYISDEALMFVKMMIVQHKPLFNYGRKWSLSKMSASTIKLPVTSDGEPDWQLIKRYIKSLSHIKKIQLYGLTRCKDNI